jgi:DNA-binding SARP family transcriptional activator
LHTRETFWITEQHLVDVMNPGLDDAARGDVRDDADLQGASRRPDAAAREMRGLRVRRDSGGPDSRSEEVDAWQTAGAAAVWSEPVRHRTSPRLALLGSFGLTHEGSDVRLSVPAQRVLAFLALQDHAVLRNHVAEMLWLDSTQDRAAGSLRSALFKLRQARGPELVETTRDRLQLAASLVVDVHEGVAWARRVLDPSIQVGDLHVPGLALTGDLLPDWYDDWVALERERFRELRVHALETLCARLSSAGRFAEAMEAGLSAIRGDPLRESAHRAVMSVHLAEGNRAEALKTYRRFRDRLQHDLGLTPSSRMDELLVQIEVR